jgi:hypothetical protein
MPASKSKFGHLFRVTHRDEVEAPMTDWLREAYEFAGMPTSNVRKSAVSKVPKRPAGATRRRAGSAAGPATTIKAKKKR